MVNAGKSYDILTKTALTDTIGQQNVPSLHTTHMNSRMAIELAALPFHAEIEEVTNKCCLCF